MKLKKIAGGLISLSLISTLLLASCDLLGIGQKEEETQEQTSTDTPSSPDTPSTPETPNIFSGKTYTEYNKENGTVFAFKSNSSLELTYNGKNSTRQYTINESESSLEIKTFGDFKYDFRGESLHLLYKGTSGYTDWGIFILSTDNSLVTEAKAGTEASTASKSESWEVSAENTFKKVLSDVKDISISGAISGKKLYVVNTNPGNVKIAADKIRLVKSYTSESAAEFSYTAANKVRTVTPLGADDSGIKERMDNYLNLEEFADLSDYLPESRATTSVVKEWKTGDSKEIWVDSSRDGNTEGFESIKVTLKAVGKHCYVWVADEYFDDSTEADTITKGSAKVTKGTAEVYAEKFDNLYEIEQNIFGKEADLLQVLYKDDERYLYKPNAEIETYSDTGKMVNIVMYDVDFDDKGNENQGGTLGYFFIKDYVYSLDEIDTAKKPGLKSYKYSNVGKYLYMDSSFINNRRDKTYGTIAHEFQHMINCGMKDITANNTPDTSYNEMCSMLAEDMLQEYIGLSDSDTPKYYRSETFNKNYSLGGIRQWNTTNNDTVLASYANSYIFGAWLTRQFGGAELVKTMLSNPFVNEDSIVSAVNSLNKTSYSFSELFEKFLLGLTGKSEYTINKDAKTGITFKDAKGNDYNYPMKAFDIYADAFKWTDADENSHNGPKVFALDENPANGLEADYGFILREIDIPEGANDLKLTFSETGFENDIIYLIVK